MNHLMIMLADIDASQVMDAQQRFMDSRFYEVAITFGSIALAILIGVIWAVYYSLKNKKRKHRHKHHRREQSNPSPFANIPEGGPTAWKEESEHRKRRRMRRPHRPMNPTLAQTHGLPPLRDENTPLPPMP